MEARTQTAVPGEVVRLVRYRCAKCGTRLCDTEEELRQALYIWCRCCKIVVKLEPPAQLKLAV